MDATMPATIFFDDLFGDTEEETPDEPFSPVVVPLARQGTTLWPSGLTFDLALGIDPTDVILSRYELTPEQYAAYNELPAFRREIAQHVKRNQEEGLTFSRRAQAIAEECLPDMYLLVKDPTIPASTRADIWKYITKVGRLEPRDKDGGGGNNGVQVAININL